MKTLVPHRYTPRDYVERFIAKSYVLALLDEEVPRVLACSLRLGAVHALAQNLSRIGIHGSLCRMATADEDAEWASYYGRHHRLRRLSEPEVRKLIAREAQSAGRVEKAASRSTEHLLRRRAVAEAIEATDAMLDAIEAKREVAA